MVLYMILTSSNYQQIKVNIMYKYNNFLYGRVLIVNRNKILKITLYLLITIVISFIICYYYLDEMFLPDYIQEFGHISFRLIIAFTIFVTTRWIFNKKITLLEKRVLYILYFVLIISLTLSRLPFDNSVNNLNLKIGYIRDISLSVLVMNIIMYLPLGLFIRKLFNIKVIPIIVIYCLIYLDLL